MFFAAAIKPGTTHNEMLLLPGLVWRGTTLVIETSALAVYFLEHTWGLSLYGVGLNGTIES
ncbi:hypothetical protein [Aestuariivivens sediminicola]|uniref:hypothetical protein n=1 Tax=Aestuariivivens sediminicola TaxID=2913560 RepID=UPI001F59A298|nr:hypothetical protein [Aestuariivivens sediminicola]